MSTYFQNIFELNTAEHKLLQFTMPHLVAIPLDQIWS